ncbi:hypothetical protein AURDEDRAFT_17950, partial [Auricularia subglabra TFB-10046 SS5]
PPWARTSTDDDEGVGKYQYSRPFPDVLPIGTDARCRCGTTAANDVAIEEMDCVIYDHGEAHHARIQVRRCPSCPRKSRMMAGPDLSSLGLFNFNNHTILSHALLNKYDTLLSGGETTYHGFCQSMSREYKSYDSEVIFLGPDRFRTCWFAFMNVQPCRDDFKCEICGPEPEVVVVDGVTVSIQKRKRTTKLRPPTYTTKSSPVHEHIKRAKQPLQLVADAKLRRKAIALARW